MAKEVPQEVASGLKPGPWGRGDGKTHRKGIGDRGKCVCRGSEADGARCVRGAPTQTPPAAASSSLQEHQGPGLANSGSPKDSPAHEVTSHGGGAYTRFDVPQLGVARSWPSFRGGGGGGAGAARAVLRACPGPVGLARGSVGRGGAGAVGPCSAHVR